MSLINQMLKDLERRSKKIVDPDVSLSGIVSPEYSQSSHENNVTTFMLVILGILTIALLSFYHKYIYTRIKHFSSTSISHEETFVPEQANTYRNIEDTTASQLTPSVMSGMTLQTQDDETDLRFVLNQDTLYSLQSDLKQNKLILVLDNTNVVANIPSVDYLKSAIKGMEMSNDRNGNLIITISLNDDVTLQQLGLNDTSGKTPELQLDFISKKNIDTTMGNLTQSKTLDTTSQTFVKTPADQFNLGLIYKNALELSAVGQNTKAIQMLTTLIEKYPEFSQARESLVTLLIESGNMAKAKKILAIGMDIDPTYPPFIQLQAKILVNQGKVNLALDLLQRAAPPIDKNPEYHAFIAALYQQTGQSLLAAKLYEQLLSQHPNKAVWWMGLGIALESQGNMSEAKVAYLRANNSGGLNPESNAFVQSRISSI